MSKDKNVIGLLLVVEMNESNPKMDKCGQEVNKFVNVPKGNFKHTFPKERVKFDAKIECS